MAAADDPVSVSGATADAGDTQGDDEKKPWLPEK
jgi:hypothetical protein